MKFATESPAPWASVVLDTNAVLDWKLFRDPRGLALWQALESGGLRWHATAEMLAELAFVLARPMGATWEAARACARAETYLLWVSVTAPPSCTDRELRCADPDDQKFLDLALLMPARWLVTRDQALLDLKRLAAERGLTILSPQRWPGGLSQRPGLAD